MGEKTVEPAWEAATWEGSRREELRRALRLTIRERLEVLEALAEASARLAEAGRRARDGGTDTDEGQGASLPGPISAHRSTLVPPEESKESLPP